MPNRHKDPAAVALPAEPAMVIVGNLTEPELVLPSRDDDQERPGTALLLTACALRRYADPTFLQA